MANLIIKRRRSGDEVREVFDRVGLEEVLRQVGRREQVSFDGGKTFVAKNKITAEHKEQFLKSQSEPPAPKGQVESPVAAKLANTKGMSVQNSPEFQKILSSLQGSFRQELLSALEGVGTGLLGTFEATTAQFSTLTTQLASLQEELTVQATQTGQAQGDYREVMEKLRRLSEEFESRLTQEAIKGEIARHVEQAVNSTVNTVEKEFTEKLQELQKQYSVLEDYQSGVEKKFEEVRREQDWIDELIDENREISKRYKPGVIEVLEQKNEALEEEYKKLQDQLREKNQELDKRDRQIARLLADEHRVELEEIQSKLEELAGRDRELGDKEALKVERDRLKERLDELEARRADYERVQEQNEDSRELKRKFHEVLAAQDVLRDQAEEAKSAEERWRKRAGRLQEKADRLESLLSEKIDELATSESKFDEALGEYEALKSREEEVQRLREENRLKVEELDWREKKIEEERAQKLNELRDQNLARLEAEREQLERHYQEKREALQAELQRAIETRFEKEIGELKKEVKMLAPFRASYDELARKYQEETSKRVEWELGAEERARLKAQEEAAIEAALEKRARLDEELEQRELRIEALRGEIGELVGERSAIKAELDALTERLERRRGELADDEEKRKASIYQPVIERHELMQRPEGEQKWLARITEKMEEAGFVFPERLVKAFHTSLKIAEWAPLTVLAGVSGTGKSELPRLYSRYGGLHHQMISVKPNWDSPQDLLGFFNYMDNRYKATDLLRGLVQSQQAGEEGGFEDQLLLVLLDEMNLARVELYFSDFLSKLEARRGLEELPTIGVDLGAGVSEEQIKLGRNVLFVGTMNEDETTMSLSDKVLDRGNVISFPRPKNLRSRDEHTLPEGVNERLALADWQHWIVTPEKGLDKEVRQKLREAMNKINQSLRAVDRAIGHRVLQAIENYVANHPDVRAADKDSDEAWKRALEDQIAQKIMPKLRGIETDTQAGRECLGGIKEVLDEYAEGLVEDFELARKSGYGAFRWSSADYLEGR